MKPKLTILLPASFRCLIADANNENFIIPSLKLKNSKMAVFSNYSEQPIAFEIGKAFDITFILVNPS